MHIKFTLLVLAGVAALTTAQAEAQAPPRIAGPSYPERASRMEKIGVVSMICVVQSDGRLTDCQVAYSSTPGFGFEDAMQNAVESGYFRLSPDKVKHAIESDFLLGFSPPTTGVAWIGIPFTFKLNTTKTDAQLAQLAQWQTEAKAAGNQLMETHRGAPTSVLPTISTPIPQTANGHGILGGLR